MYKRCQVEKRSIKGLTRLKHSIIFQTGLPENPNIESDFPLIKPKGPRKEWFLMAENIINVTDSTFDSMVLKSEVPALVDFWASWCAPCRAIAPIVDEMATEYTGRIRVAKMNVDDNPATPGRYGVRGIPTLILFKDGKVIDQLVGAVPKNQIKELIEKGL